MKHKIKIIFTFKKFFEFHMLTRNIKFHLWLAFQVHILFLLGSTAQVHLRNRGGSLGPFLLSSKHCVTGCAIVNHS